MMVDHLFIYLAPAECSVLSSWSSRELWDAAEYTFISGNGGTNQWRTQKFVQGPIFSQGRPEPLETKAFTDPGGRGYIKIGQFFIQKRVVANGKDLLHQVFFIFFFICNLHDVLYTNI